MELDLHGVTVTVDEKQIARLLLERLARPSPNLTPRLPALPRIGTYWQGQGSIFTGLVLGNDTLGDTVLITADTDFEPGDHASLKARAERYTADGHVDFSLPFRPEQAVQFANIRSRFKEEYYWSIEQHREGSGGAYVQNFGYGYQGWFRKDCHYRGVAVRRFPLHSLIQ